MTAEKADYPEQGEFILGTVASIFNQGGFIDLDEYPGKRGMLHITEISLKWVRNIRDYIKEGQKVVLLVLRVDESKGHIDLSLRRVNDSQRKAKLQEVKKLQRARKLVEVAAKELKVDKDKLYESLDTTYEDDYESLYDAFENISIDDSIMEGAKLDKKSSETLLELIKSNIKPPEVKIIGYVELKSYESGGISDIRGALKAIKKAKSKDSEIDITYISAPTYRVTVKAGDYKSAEKTLKKACEAGIKFIESKKGVGEFHRELDNK